VRIGKGPFALRAFILEDLLNLGTSQNFVFDLAGLAFFWGIFPSWRGGGNSLGATELGINWFSLKPGKI